MRIISIYLWLQVVCSHIDCFRSLRLDKPKISPLWSGPRIRRKDIKKLKLVILLGILSLETSAEIFARLPQQWIYGSTPKHISKSEINKPNLVLIFPGAGGPDDNLNSLKNSIITNDNNRKVDRDVVVYDWLQWRGSFVRAAFDGQIVGKTVCKDLFDSNPQLENVHIIGVSVGAFAADSCAKTLKSQMPIHRIQTRLTFLDPFTSKGIFGYAWGVKNFGKDIDYVENYVNRDDEVPTTNDPLNLAINYDVTKSRLRDDFQTTHKGESMHSWPGK